MNLSARNSAKAIILNNDKILVNRCMSRFGEYFTLPGGGQQIGEILLESVRREVLEETGYSVRPLRLSGIYERSSQGREEGICHKIYFIFLCHLESMEKVAPCETDRYQVDSIWVPLREIRQKNLFPRAIRDNIPNLISYAETYYIGSESDH